MQQRLGLLSQQQEEQIAGNEGAPGLVRLKYLWVWCGSDWLWEAGLKGSKHAYIESIDWA